MVKLLILQIKRITHKSKKLTPEETRRIEEICETIKPLDNESLLAFGANLQQKMSPIFSSYVR